MATSNSSSSTARQALLQTISERERELGRIRDAAEKIIEEEQCFSKKQLQNLETQLVEQQRLVQEKDEYIQRLCSQIQSLEHDFREHQQIIEEKSKDELERQVAKIHSGLEKEYADANKDNEARERKRLQMEFEDKLASCERKFQSEYQTSLLCELKKQEDTLWSNFERSITEKQSKHEQVEKELHDILRRKEMDILDIVRQYESKCDFSQTKLLSDLQTEKDRFKEIIDDLNKRNDALRMENEKVNNIYECTRDRLVHVEKEAAYTKDQVEQLLEVLHRAEENYVQKVHQFQSAQSSKASEISSLLDQNQKLSLLLKEAKTKYRRDLRQAKKIFSTEKKCFQGKIADLKNELNTINEAKAKEIESSKLTTNEGKNKILLLTNELENLRQEYRNREEVINRMEKQSNHLQKELGTKCEEATSAKMKIQEMKATLKLERTHFEDRMQIFAKEMDVSNNNMQKEIMELKMQQHASLTSAEIEAASAKDLKKENNALQLSLDEANRENNGLKGTVKAMRKELEELMNSTNQVKSPIFKSDDEILSILTSIHEKLKHTIGDCDRSTLEKYGEVLSQIGKVIGEKSADMNGKSE